MSVRACLIRHFQTMPLRNAAEPDRSVAKPVRWPMHTLPRYDARQKVREMPRLEGWGFVCLIGCAVTVALSLSLLAGAWRPYPLATLMTRDKTLFYQHDLAPETMTVDKATLTWNLAYGYMLSYDVSSQYLGGEFRSWPRRRSG